MAGSRSAAPEIQAFVVFVERYRQWFIGVGTVAVIVAVLAALIANRRTEAELRAWEKLYGVMVVMDRDTAESEKLLNEVRQSARSGPLAGVVRYLSASLAFEKGDFAAAADFARAFIRHGRPAAFVPLGYLLLGQSARATGNTAAAIEALSVFTNKYRGHALEPMALEMLMQTYASAGNVAKMREIAEQITISNPNTEWAERAERLLSTATPVVRASSAAR